MRLKSLLEAAALAFIAERLLAMTAPNTHDRLLRRRPNRLRQAASYVATHPQIVSQVAALVGGVALGRQAKSRRPLGAR